MRAPFQLAILDLVASVADPLSRWRGDDPPQWSPVQQLVERQPPILYRVPQKDRDPRQKLPAILLLL